MRQSAKTTPDMLTVHQASEMLGITENGVRERIRRGNLPGVKNGRGWRVAATDVLESRGVDRAVARYLCQFLAENISKNLNKHIDEAIARAFSQKAAALARRVEELSRELGGAEARLEAALGEVSRLTGDVGAVVGELGRGGRTSVKGGAGPPRLTPPLAPG